MLTYKAAYRMEDNVCYAQVLDFPGVLTFGYSLKQARLYLADALKLMVEVCLEQGEPLPVPDPQQHDSAADVEEPIFLTVHAGSRLRQRAVP